MPNGAPWPVTVGVAATGGPSFTWEVSIRNGRIESEPFKVTGDDATQLRFVSQPDVAVTYQGVRIVLGGRRPHKR